MSILQNYLLLPSFRIHPYQLPLRKHRVAEPVVLGGEEAVEEVALLGAHRLGVGGHAAGIEHGVALQRRAAGAGTALGAEGVLEEAGASFEPVHFKRS